MQEHSTTDAAAAVLKRMGLVLPASAHVELAEQIRGMDDSARLVAVMPEADWTSLRATITREAPHGLVFSADENATFGPAEDGWHASDTPGLTTAETTWANGSEGLTIGFAPAAPGRVRVFLFWFQT